MKFSRIDLLTLLISLFILTGCKNQNTIGLGNAATQVDGTLLDTARIIINTVLEDSVSTTNLAKQPLGYFNDPIIGISQSDLATDLNLPGGGAYTLPVGTIKIDSARLVLNFADGFYGDSIESTYKVNVYQLNENFDHSATYYSNRKWNYNANNLLGTLTFNARTHDSIKISRIITGAPDTLVKVPPEIRIPFNTNFVNQYLFNANGITLGSNVIFQSIVKGLYITMDKTKSTGAGGIFMLSSDSLQVYYRAIAPDGTIDTGVVDMPITSSAAAIRHTYTPAVQAALNNTGSSSKTFYLQGLAGLRAKISFPNLDSIRTAMTKQGYDMLINRAELVITPSANTTIPFQPLPKITMYTLDIANQPVLLEDASTTDPRSGGITTFGGFYASNKQNYHFVITAFIQDLLLGKIVDYGTYIAPIDTTNTSTVDIAETPQVAARTVAIGTDKNSQYKLTLNVIYTKIKYVKPTNQTLFKKP
jgi:Domain of unknown function (DUF4270)